MVIICPIITLFFEATSGGLDDGKAIIIRTVASSSNTDILRMDYKNTKEAEKTFIEMSVKGHNVFEIDKKGEAQFDILYENTEGD